MEGGRRNGGGSEGKKGERKGEAITAEESMHTLRVTFTLLLLCVNVHGRTLFSLLSLLLQRGGEHGVQVTDNVSY